MSISLWLLYLSVITVLIITPGPIAVLCMSHGAQYGKRKSLATVTGGMFAALTLMLASGLGLGAIIMASETAFWALKLCGAAYLIYLGIQTWRAPLVIKAQPVEQNTSNKSAYRLLRSGYLVGIGNPKDLLFFGALFPQFIVAEQPLFEQLAILAITWLVIDFSLMFAYAVLGNHLISALQRLGLTRIFNRITGGAFMVAGGALIVAQR
ncbi:LysE family transporter [Pseudomonas sp. F1_0610]|uniref:LysE family translocator n=1 Tax=Pseudomonas sp. F1_0610 TaxID=3114284 RepID=UPI0039C12BE1